MSHRSAGNDTGREKARSRIGHIREPDETARPPWDLAGTDLANATLLNGDRGLLDVEPPPRIDRRCHPKLPREQTDPVVSEMTLRPAMYSSDKPPIPAVGLTHVPSVGGLRAEMKSNSSSTRGR